MLPRLRLAGRALLKADVEWVLGRPYGQHAQEGGRGDANQSHVGQDLTEQHRDGRNQRYADERGEPDREHVKMPGCQIGQAGVTHTHA